MYSVIFYKLFYLIGPYLPEMITWCIILNINIENDFVFKIRNLSSLHIYVYIYVYIKVTSLYNVLK